MPPRKNLTSNEKNRLAQFLIANCKNGVVLNGKIRDAAAMFGISRRAVHYIWKDARTQMSENVPVQMKNNRKGQSKKKHLQFNFERFKAIPINKRTTLRSIARELGVSKTQVSRWIKSGQIRRHSNAVKPTLTDSNKVDRIKFSLNELVLQSVAKTIKFSGMFHVVHIDEKWFYMSRTTEIFYLAEGEEEPYRSCKSKRYIPKVMFMCAVARPQNAIAGQQAFDGKIGIWPFTKLEPAQRNSKNRLRGTLVTKPIDSITKEVTKACLLNQVIPAIKAKWPPNASKNIIIQQDNAKPHISNDDPDFRAAASSDGFNIIIACQPPNSPDTNILDLGFFRAIQSLQVDTASYTIDELVTNVLQAFDRMTPVALNNVFVTLQSCLVEIMKNMGHNKYKVPHMNKERLIREGRLPVSLEVDEEVVRGCIQFLIEAGEVDGLTKEVGDLMTGLGY